MPDTSLTFSADEVELLSRSADALTAYLGKPVLAELMDAEEMGYEWVVFAIPFDLQDDPDGSVRVQLGGEGAKLLGNTGGVALEKGESYDCQFLWAIQLSPLEGVRFIKVNDEGEEVAWSDNLNDILPFDASKEPEAPPDDDSDDGDVPDYSPAQNNRTLH